MATILDAVKSKALEAFDLPQWEVRLPIRSFWVNPEFWDWVDAKPELWDLKFSEGRRTLYEHMEQLFCDFRCSKTFPVGDLRQMMPTRHGIRKLHPFRLRIYGWCPGPHQFVAVTGALEAETKSDKSLNDKKRDEVRGFIKRNQLEKTVVLGDINAVFPPQD